MASITTSNGLEKIDLGNGVGDFDGADRLPIILQKLNTNIDIDNVALGNIITLQSKMTSLVNKGFTVGFINGGVCTAP